jgi:hypothetical protein
LNNDVLFEGPVDHYQGYKRDAVFANEIILHRIYGLVIPYPKGWMYFLHKSAKERIGPWDVNFKSAIADDLDYGWRAWKEGIPVLEAGMPLKHLNQEHHSSRKEAMNENRQYFWEKHGFSGRYSRGR